ADTWAWNGTSWTEFHPGAHPSQRHLHAMAYDPLRRRSVLFGGEYTPANQNYGDTWEWDGADWFLRHDGSTAPPRPLERRGHSMTFDPQSGGGRVVVFGGMYSDLNIGLSDIWSWDGGAGQWTDLTPSPDRYLGGFRPTLSYDASSQKLRYFGGQQ